MFTRSQRYKFNTSREFSLSVGFYVTGPEQNRRYQFELRACFWNRGLVLGFGW